MDSNHVEPLASELYEDLKNSNAFKEKVIKWLLWVIAILIALLAATNVYHIYQWSQFETVVVDSGEGSGNANYVQGDNTGGIYNGEGNSQAQEERENEGNQN